MSNCGREQSLAISDRDKQRASAPMTSGLLPEAHSAPSTPHPPAPKVLPLLLPNGIPVGQSDDNKMLTFTESLLCTVHRAKHCACTVLILTTLRRIEYFYPHPTSEGTEAQNGSDLPEGCSQ
uniref:Uncharacterized protein n=1 Tax=Pipistrellus kuhlii TaxID=59472 RepID=A0A7J7XB36_PIPKU|nr:hypothetical protein mPipKuh1_010612 [Pipistrellus kuhlii]